MSRKISVGIADPRFEIRTKELANMEQ